MTEPKLQVRFTPEARRWIERLRDRVARDKVVMRLDGLALGRLGDWRSVGDGVSELRIHHGPGYRLYFTRRGDFVIVVLLGGDKDGQSRDIARARVIAAELEA